MDRISIASITVVLLSICAIPILSEDSSSSTIAIDPDSGYLEDLVSKNYSGSSHVSIDIKSDPLWIWNYYQGGWPESFDDRSDMAWFWGTNEVLYYQSYYKPPQWEYRFYILNLTERDWDIVNTGIPDEQYLDYDFATIYHSDKVLIMKTMTQGNGLNFSLYDGSERKEEKLDFPMQLKYGPRSDANIVSIADSSKVLFWGGRTGVYPNYTYLRDSWVFDLKTGTWTEILPANLPPPRFYHSLSPIWGTDKAIMFGGVNNTMINETWLFDLSENAWALLRDASDPPARTYADMAPIPRTDKVVLFGGTDGKDMLNTTYEFDLKSLRWSNVIQPTIMTPRAKHFMVESEFFDGVLMWGANSALYRFDIYNPSKHIERGNYTMPPVEIGQGAMLKKVSWNETHFDGTSIGFKIRYGHNLNDILKQPFAGAEKDGLFTDNPTSFNSTPPDAEFVQLRFTFSTGDPICTPVLNSVTIEKNVPPTVRPIYPEGDVSNLSMRLSWDYFDADSDPQTTIQFEFIGPMNLSYNSTILTSYNTTDIDLPDPVDGSWRWRIRAMDSDGNWGPFSEWTSIRIDLTSPTSTISYPLGEFFKKVDSISGTADDRSGDLDRVMVMIRRGGSFFDGSGWTNDESWAMARGTDHWVLNCSLAEGSYIVRSRSYDSSGNVQKVDSETIFVVDSTPPENITVLINNGQNKTTLSQVELALSCGSDLSGVSKMAFSTDGRNWTGWMDYNTTHKIFIGDAYGLKTVHFKAMDRAGNEAEPVFDSIEYNRTSPPSVGTPTDPDDEFDPILLLVPLIVIVIVAAILFVSIVKPKKKEVPSE